MASITKRPGTETRWASYPDIELKELLGYRDVSTTMIYTHVLNRGGRGAQSPADRLTSKPR